MRRIVRRPAMNVALLLGALGALHSPGVFASPAKAPPADAKVAADLAAVCQPVAMQAVASRLSIKVRVQELPRDEIPGPYLSGGTAFTPASKGLPAYCQVTGSFVTNVQ